MAGKLSNIEKLALRTGVPVDKIEEVFEHANLLAYASEMNLQQFYEDALHWEAMEPPESKD